MKKTVWIILFVLLAFAALPALAVTDGELLSVEIVESAMPDALPAAGISGAVVGNAAEPTGEERTSSEWPELDAVKVLSADSIEQIEWIAYTEGGAQRTVITDRTAVSDVHARCCVLSLGDETDIGVADDGLTLTFVTAEGSTALRFEGSYAVIGKKRYETENLNLLETYLKTVTEGQALSSDENTLKNKRVSAETKAAASDAAMRIFPTEAQGVYPMLSGYIGWK